MWAMMGSSDLVISPGVRAARAILGWSQRELASRSRVSVPSINRFERGEGEPREITVRRLVDCLESHGIRLTITPEGGLEVHVAADVVAQVVQRALNEEAVTPRGKFGPRKLQRESEEVKLS